MKILVTGAAGSIGAATISKLKKEHDLLGIDNFSQYYSSSYKRNDEGQFMTKDGTDDFSFSNLILEVNELKNPYGSFKIKYYDSKGFHCGSLVNEEDYIELKNTTELDDTIESILISRLINDEIKKELLIDNGPQFDSAGFSVEDR